ncbi:hypothetical protein EJE96_19410 [Pandoraea apista]|nr:hypothetical protein EJE96_19410 [Pandoraea apista]
MPIRRPGTMQATRSLYLLGPMRVEQGKQACAVKYTKARGLLAYLALQPGYHTRGALADLFWPDEDGQGGRDKLKRMLFHLRDTLGDELFESDRQVVRLRPETGLWIDAHVFASMIEQANRTLDGVTGLDLAANLQHLADAVALYQGPFLHGLSVRDTPDLEQWIELQREEYQRRRVFGERLLADGYARLGDLDQALAHARQLVALAPFDESGWHCLLALLLRAGRRDEAETEYRRLCDVLREELGEMPGAALTQLLETPPARMEQRATGPERRQLTVVAIEFAPNGIDDPDQLVGMMRPPLVQCETILRQSWGYTMRTPTGGLLGYFGYPTALEGAGRHAVEAAMRCVQASTARVGIGAGVHTGLVISSVADDSPDTGGRVSRSATQLADMALPGEVVICDATQRLIGVAIATTPHGTVRERHANRDISVFRVNPDPTPERRSRRRAAMLFGRDAVLAELSCAHSAMRDASTAQGMLALVIGEAGIGKSALVRHFIETRGLRAIDLACAQDGAGTPFHPIARWLRTQSAADASQLPQPALLAHRRLRALFDMHADGNVPHAWKQAVLDEAPALLAALLPDGGVLMLDDAHWADPSTQELLALMAENPPAGRLLIVCARPEFELPWHHTASLRRIDLAPLDAGRLHRARRDTASCPAGGHARAHRASRRGGPAVPARAGTRHRRATRRTWPRWRHADAGQPSGIDDGAHRRRRQRQAGGSLCVVPRPRVSGRRTRRRERTFDDPGRARARHAGRLRPRATSGQRPLRLPSRAAAQSRVRRATAGAPSGCPPADCARHARARRVGRANRARSARLAFPAGRRAGSGDRALPSCRRIRHGPPGLP